METNKKKIIEENSKRKSTPIFLNISGVKETILEEPKKPIFDNHKSIRTGKRKKKKK